MLQKLDNVNDNKLLCQIRSIIDITEVVGVAALNPTSDHLTDFFLFPRSCVGMHTVASNKI